MTHNELKEFLEKRMRMSHIYQPVMILSLLENEGNNSDTGIAKDILVKDESQIDYYRSIVHNMVGKVLRSHQIVTRHKDKSYTLEGFEHFSIEQIEELKAICLRKVDEYQQRRGINIWSHRTKSSGYISGSIKYTVLKRAKFRCELCGISADEKALEVDHIVPRNHGGTDDIENLQALCYSCNAMKRDTDDTDFREVKAAYSHRKDGCVFCSTEAITVVHENRLCLVVKDAYPVTDDHHLVIPKRHVSSYFELGQPEINAANQLLMALKLQITERDKQVQGFNIGINQGEVAGQTVEHCHIHIIPRRQGDMNDPRGGVRGVVPEKRVY